jgi:transcriptional regulator with XRE-family HTH domain
MPQIPKQRADQRSRTGIDSYVGRRLRERRILLGLSQEWLGAMLGVSYQQVQKYEKAGNRVSASRLYQLSQLLGVPIAWFFDGIDDRADIGTAPKSPHPVDPDVLRFVRTYYRIANAGARFRLREMATVLAGKR